LWIAFPFCFFSFYAIYVLLSIYIKLGSIGSKKISIANRVPTDRFIVLVLAKSWGDGWYARIAKKTLLYNM